MSMARDMQVTLRLPMRTLFDGRATRLGASAPNGRFGMLPNHVDFVTALVPSVLTLTTPEGSEMIFGIDEGVLVKMGHRVDVAIRRGVRGDSLDTLRETVERTILRLDEDERETRTALSGLEASLVRHFARLSRPRT